MAKKNYGVFLKGVEYRVAHTPAEATALAFSGWTDRAKLQEKAEFEAEQAAREAEATAAAKSTVAGPAKATDNKADKPAKAK